MDCPKITLPPLSAQVFGEAMSAAQKATTNKRLRPTPMGSLSLDLGDGDAEGAMDRFQSADRYELPDLASFQRKIADDDFEIEMPRTTRPRRPPWQGQQELAGSPHREQMQAGDVR